MQLEPNVQTFMVRAYAALQDGDVVSSESHVNGGMQQALTKWWQLPDIGAAPHIQHAHIQLLQQFQQLVELKESARVLVDVSNSRPDHPYGDVKDIMETWRLRTPNEWDSMLHWQDLLVWRNNIYNIVIQAFNRLSEVAPQLHQMGYRDKAWSVNKLGHIAARWVGGKWCGKIALRSVPCLAQCNLPCLV